MTVKRVVGDDEFERVELHIAGHEDGDVECEWRDSYKKPQKDFYSPEMLEIVE